MKFFLEYFLVVLIVGSTYCEILPLPFFDTSLIYNKQFFLNTSLICESN